VTFSHSSKGRLTDRDLARFPGTSLFDRLARAVCHAGCLPRKELYEAWETARRVRRVFRGGRIVDLAAGHGLLAHVLLILDNSSSQILQAGRVIALHHHERWDGAGYPNGLAGGDIPLWGRICAVADVFDAVTSERPYKPPFPNEEALQLLRDGKGKHFDPRSN